MCPRLESGEFSELRNFRLILILNNLGVLIIRLEETFGRQLQTMSHAHQLCFKIMLFLAREGRLSI